MTPCNHCHRPALIRIGDTLWCEVCYALILRDQHQAVVDAATYRTAEWARAKAKIDGLDRLIKELWRDCRERRRAA